MESIRILEGYSYVDKTKEELSKIIDSSVSQIELLGKPGNLSYQEFISNTEEVFKEISYDIVKMLTSVDATRPTLDDVGWLGQHPQTLLNAYRVISVSDDRNLNEVKTALTTLNSAFGGVSLDNINHRILVLINIYYCRGLYSYMKILALYMVVFNRR